MRNWLAQIGQFLEAHVEKLVLGVACVVALYLLVTQVLLSPNRVKYKDRAYSPGTIDAQVSRVAKDVEEGLNREPQPQPPYDSKLSGVLDVNDPVRVGIRAPLKGGFQGLFADPLGHFDRKIPLLPRTLAGQPTPSRTEGRVIELPDIGEVLDAQVAHIRAAAYVPTVPVTEQDPYQETTSEIDDLDLVTVEAKVDVTRLVSAFHESFLDDDLDATDTDTSVAEPVFAAVQLQRRRALDGGQWSEWMEVPRSRVEARRESLKVSETGGGIGGSVQVRRIQFTNPQVLCDLLQPPAYQIASAYEEWLPPSLHGEFIRELTKQKREEQRQAQQERSAQQDATRGGRRGALTEPVPGMTPEMGMGGRGGLRGRGTAGVDPRTGRAGARAGGRYDARTDPLGGAGEGMRGARRGGARAGTGQVDLYGQDPTLMGMAGAEGQMGLTQVYLKLEQIRLTPFTDWAKLKELVFWHHDDTVEPDARYQYRIRLGVLNPVAGSDQGEGQGQMILWSRWSDETPVVEIPARQYLFAKDFQETTGAVGVEVCRFLLGHWRTQDFSVRPGEVIGRIVESKSDEPRSRTPMALTMPGLAPLQTEDQVFKPAEVDYSTGVLLVAVERVDGWAGDNRLRAQAYYEMLTSADGSDIRRTPIGTPNWSREQSAAFGAIKRSVGTEIEPPRAWADQTMGGAGRGTPYDYPGGAAGRMPINLYDRGG